MRLVVKRPRRRDVRGRREGVRRRFLVMVSG